MSTIRFFKVNKQFPGATEPAVRDCSLDVKSGEFIVLLGHSGCGKTTLLKMVNRIHEPTSGEIYIDRKDIRQMDATLLRRQIGYVIQQVGLFPHMTVAQNICVVPKLLKWTPEKMDTRVDELLQLIELEPGEYRNRYPSQLSGGQQQRVGLARALAADPGVMLMDEPFGAIDAITRNSLQEEMLRLQSRLEKTILFVTHDVDEAMRLADRIVIMNQGRVEQFDTPLAILSAPASEFVRELTGADDMIRRLSLLRAEKAMEPLPKKHDAKAGPSIDEREDLRSALSILLGSESSTLTVTEDDEPVGVLSLARIKSLARKGGES